MINTNIRDVKCLGKLLLNDENAYIASEQLSKVGVAIIDDQRDDGEFNIYVLARIKPDQLKRRGEKIILNLPGMKEGAAELAEEIGQD